MKNLHPVILCGGVGTRLWPLSRSQQPKQFQAISGDTPTTFFQGTVLRHVAAMYGRPLVSARTGHVPTVRRQLRDIGVDADIVAEPMARNTGPALLAIALQLHSRNAEAVMLALPSDHVISGDFDSVIFDALPAAADGLIVAFGITPRYPETGYGYMVDTGGYLGYSAVRRLSGFIEKPVSDVATALIAAGNAYWATGISLFRADVLIAEYAQFDPATLTAVKEAVDSATEIDGVTYLGERYGQARSSSTESAIFEHSRLTALAPAAIGWDDVGAWSSFHAIGKKNAEGNVTSGDVIMVDSHNSYVRAGGRLVAVVGMSDVVVVDTDDALLITNRASTQSVRKVVDQLTSAHRQEAVEHRWLTTDWGRVGTLSTANGFVLKQLHIEPGLTVVFEPLAGRRSLITIADGDGMLLIAGTKRGLKPGDTVDVGPNVTASITNVGDSQLQAIEVNCDPERAILPLQALEAANDRGAGIVLEPKIIELPASTAREAEQYA